MKRLMIAVSALALAFGLNAAMAPVGTSFEKVPDGPDVLGEFVPSAVHKLAGGADWVIPDDDANQQLTVTAHDSAPTGANRPKQYNEADPFNYLAVRTSFGKPVTLKSGAAAVEIPASGLYFDSEVKLTACDADPDITAYDGAKILVYALEDETTGATTLKAQCGYVAADGTVTPKTYDLGPVDCGKWSRLTIKAIKTIASSEAYSIPGFVIYLDAINPDGKDGIASDAERVAPGFPLSGAAKALGNKLFPAYVKSFEDDNGKIAGVGFDGQGGVDDLVFTDETPFDAAKAVAATVGDQSFETLQEAINYVNDEAAGEVTLRVVDASGFAGVEFANDNVTSLTIDLNGQTLRVAEGNAINSDIPLTIVDSDAEKQGRVVPGEGEGFAVYATALTVQDGTFDGAVVATDTETVFLLQGACRFLADANPDLPAVAECPEGMELVEKDGYLVLAYKPKTVIFIAEGETVKTIEAPYGEPIPEELIPADPAAPKTWQKFGAWFDGDEPYDFGAEVTEDLELTAKFVEGFTKDDAGNCLIADVDDLNKLAAYVDDGEDTAGKVFKQTADIDFAAVDTVAFPGIGTYADGANILNTNTKAFCGTYDGDGKTIKNLRLQSTSDGTTDGSAKQGTGLFNVLRYATVKNLTIDTVIYEPEISLNKQGGAMLAGNVVGSEIIGVTTKGTNGSAEKPVTYNAAGLVARIEAGGEKQTRIIDCTNEADIYCGYTKIAGICPIINGFAPQQPTVISGCVNKGKIVGVSGTVTGKVPGVDGIAGILAYSQGGTADFHVTIQDCSNQGELTGAETSKIGSLVGWLNNFVTFAGANTSTKFYPAIGNFAAANAKGEIPYFAKVDAETMTGTFCKDVAANGIYAATIANANAIKFGEKIGDWLYITKNICAYTGEVTTEVEGAKVEKTDFVDPTTGIASFKYEIVADAPAIPEVAPGGAPVKVEAASAEEAISKVTVKATSPDAAVIADEDYAKYFKPVAYDLGDGTFSVTALLDEAVVAPDEVAAEIAGKFDEITDAGVEVAAKPGLYYSVEQGASLGAMTEGDRVMATGDTVTIPATKFEGAGFYKVLVNTTAKDIVE